MRAIVPVLRAFLRRPLGILALGLLVVLLLSALLADALAAHGFVAQFRGLELKPPGTRAPDGSLFLLGTDELGRDSFSRLLHGARISLYVGLVSVTGAVLIGTTAGMVAGYAGGAADALIQRLVEIFMSMPVIVLAMVISTVLGAGINGVVIAVMIIQWPRVARVVRGDVLAVKSLPYVEAARSVGARHGRIMLQHILPNVTSSLLILATTNLGAAIMLEAALAFLAVGATAPTPSWGLMIADGREYLVRDPKLLFIPGAAISLVVLTFNLGGDLLRDILDPRLSQTKALH